MLFDSPLCLNVPRYVHHVIFRKAIRSHWELSARSSPVDTFFFIFQNSLFGASRTRRTRAPERRARVEAVACLLIFGRHQRECGPAGMQWSELRVVPEESADARQIGWLCSKQNRPCPGVLQRAWQTCLIAVLGTERLARKSER
jgi:hypothetical protein